MSYRRSWGKLEDSLSLDISMTDTIQSPAADVPGDDYTRRGSVSNMPLVGVDRIPLASVCSL